MLVRVGQHKQTDKQQKKVHALTKLCTTATRSKASYAHLSQRELKDLLVQVQNGNGSKARHPDVETATDHRFKQRLV